jgi:hypothetical protein
MSQEPSLRQSGRFVRRALTAYTLRRIFEDRPFDTTDVWLRDSRDAAMAAAIDAMVPQARYMHGTLKLVPLRKALQGLVGSGLVVTEAGHWRCTGGTGQ